MTARGSSERLIECSGMRNLGVRSFGSGRFSRRDPAEQARWHWRRPAMSGRGCVAKCRDDQMSCIGPIVLRQDVAFATSMPRGDRRICSRGSEAEAWRIQPDNAGGIPKFSSYSLSGEISIPRSSQRLPTMQSWI
jgi:hypothetical protein